MPSSLWAVLCVGFCIACFSSWLAQLPAVGINPLLINLISSPGVRYILLSTLHDDWRCCDWRQSRGCSWCFDLAFCWAAQMLFVSCALPLCRFMLAVVDVDEYLLLLVYICCIGSGRTEFGESETSTHFLRYILGTYYKCIMENNIFIFVLLFY